MAWPATSARSKDWGTEILTDADLEAQLDLLHTYINDMMNSSSGHKHDGTTAEGPKILTANIDDSAGTAGDVMYSDGSSITRLAVGTAANLLAVNSGATAPEWVTLTWDDLPDGAAVQAVNTITGAVATGTTAMPYDDTIPQNTEGTEFMTLAITPKATTNKLKIDVTVVGANSATEQNVVALFQDSTAGALASIAHFGGNASAANSIETMSFTHWMAAGTTSATTFKVRAGIPSGSTFTFNGSGGARKLGGVIASSVTITEIKAS